MVDRSCPTFLTGSTAANDERFNFPFVAIKRA